MQWSKVKFENSKGLLIYFITVNLLIKTNNTDCIYYADPIKKIKRINKLISLKNTGTLLMPKDYALY